MLNRIKLFLTIWLIILIINQVVIFGACFAPYCLIAALPHTGIISFLVTRFILNSSKDQRNLQQRPKSRPKDNLQSSKQRHIENFKSKKPITKPNVTFPSVNKKFYGNKTALHNDPLKVKGDLYEKEIGLQFEKKGYLVIYNGFINGFADQGVDLIAISEKDKTINLIQCKNWTLMRLSLDKLESVYYKLSNYHYDFFNYSELSIKRHLQLPSEQNVQQCLANIQSKLASYQIRKTLYIASDKVVDLDVGQYLTMFSPSIFKYKEMKIVTTTTSK